MDSSMQSCTHHPSISTSLTLVESSSRRLRIARSASIWISLRRRSRSSMARCKWNIARTPQADGYKKDVRAGEMLTGDASDSGQYSPSRRTSNRIPGTSGTGPRPGRSRCSVKPNSGARQLCRRPAATGGPIWTPTVAGTTFPGKGQVWQPTLALDADFDPYGYGSWVAYPGAGYVWASGYSWGWTPFRCGRLVVLERFWLGLVARRRLRTEQDGVLAAESVMACTSVNVGHPPLNYRLPTRPVHEPAMLHPIPVGSAPREPGTWLHHLA